MRQIKVLSLAALAALSFTVKAQADSMATPAAPIATAAPIASGTPQRGVDEAGQCTRDFIMGYSATGSQIKNLVSYVKANPSQVPPNLGAVLLACSQFEAAFATVTCSAMKADKTVVSIVAADLLKHCDSVRQIAAQLPPVNPGGVITDNSPISTLNPKNLTATVANISKLQAAATQPGMTYIIDGDVLSMGSALLRDAPVRCAILREGKTPLNISGGDTIRASDVDEAFANSTHISQLGFGSVDLIIRCASKTSNAVTLGDMRKAFNGILNFSYAP